MAIGLVGKKCGMTRIFTEAGVSIPVTVVEVTANRISQIKTQDTDGYQAIQVTTGERRDSRVNAAQKGHFAKAGVAAGRGTWEFRVEDSELEGREAGSEIAADLFQVGQIVDVIGTSKGKGFQGGIKRHNFRSQDWTHGNSVSHRVVGSTGQNQTPGRVFKGKKMPGQYGNTQNSVKNEILSFDAENKIVAVVGSVSGANGSLGRIKVAK